MNFFEFLIIEHPKIPKFFLGRVKNSGCSSPRPRPILKSILVGPTCAGLPEIDGSKNFWKIFKKIDHRNQRRPSKTSGSLWSVFIGNMFVWVFNDFLRWSFLCYICLVKKLLIHPITGTREVAMETLVQIFTNFHNTELYFIHILL